jgi:Protein of Unknown function (DUF2784)
VVFATLGGLLALRWPRVAWLHLPAVAWGVAVELTGWICPLTPLEVSLRESAGGEGYAGGFLDRYLVPLLYPSALTRRDQWLLAAGLLLLNLAVYGLVLRRGRHAGARVPTSE